MMGKIKKEIIVGVISAIVGALVTGIFSVAIFMAEKKSIEEETVKKMSEYFDSVDKDMSYDEAFKAIYQKQKELADENERLNSKLTNLEANVTKKMKLQ